MVTQRKKFRKEEGGRIKSGKGATEVGKGGIEWGGGEGVEATARMGDEGNKVKGWIGMWKQKRKGKNAFKLEEG